MNLKKMFSIALSLTLAASCVLTGCGQSTVSENDNEGEKIVLRLATWDDVDAAKNTQKLIDEFESENPNIKVQFEPTSDDYMTKLRTSISAGNAPDVMMVDEWPTLYPVQPFEPLDEYFKKYNFDTSIFAPSVLKLWNYNGKQYGLPADINLPGFFYNKKLFDEAGLPYPDENWTYDDLKKYAEKLTKGEGPTKTYGIFMASNWIGAIEPMIWGYGGKLIDDDLKYDGVMNSKETAQALEWYASFEKNGLSPKTATAKSMGGSTEMFKAGKIGMILAGHWTLQSLKTSEGFDMSNVGTAPLPKGPTGIKPAVVFSAGWHMSKDSKHKDAAFKLLIKMASNDAQKMKAEAGWSLPAIPTLLADLKFDNDPLRKPFIDMAFGDDYTINKFSIYYSPVGSSIDQELQTAMEKVILDKADAETALDEAVKNIKMVDEK